MRLQNRKMLVDKIRAEVDLDRLADLLANDYMMQEAAGELKKAIEEVERKE